METFIYLVRCKYKNRVVLATNSIETAKEDTNKLNTYFNAKNLYYVETVHFIYGKRKAIYIP